MMYLFERFWFFILDNLMQVLYYVALTVFLISAFAVLVTPIGPIPALLITFILFRFVRR